MFFRNKRGICLSLAVLFAVNIAVILIAQSVSAATYQKGSSGQKVTEIQTRLKEWGYYSGEVDGVFGSGTETAAVSYTHLTLPTKA